MAISLKKGTQISLSKEVPSLKKVHVGLGWVRKATVSGADFDLDAAAFLLNAQGKARSERDFVFYNQLRSAEGAVEHQGDHLVGSSGDQDDEVILVDLTRMPSDVVRVVFTVSIYDAARRGQTFGQVQSAYIRLLDAETRREVARYDLASEKANSTALIFGDLIRSGREWRFSALGQHYAGDLAAICHEYGINAA